MVALEKQYWLWSGRILDTVWWLEKRYERKRKESKTELFALTKEKDEMFIEMAKNEASRLLHYRMPVYQLLILPNNMIMKINLKNYLTFLWDLPMLILWILDIRFC